jgi:hypothetical protein
MPDALTPATLCDLLAFGPRSVGGQIRVAAEFARSSIFRLILSRSRFVGWRGT